MDIIILIFISCIAHSASFAYIILNIRKSPVERLNELRTHSINVIKKLVAFEDEYVFHKCANLTNIHDEVLRVTSVKFHGGYISKVAIKFMGDNGRILHDTIEVLSTDAIVKLTSLISLEIHGEFVNIEY